MAYYEAYMDSLWVFLGIPLEITHSEYQEMLNLVGKFHRSSQFLPSSYPQKCSQFYLNCYRRDGT